MKIQRGLRAAAKGGQMLKADPALGKGKCARLAHLLPDVTDDAARQLSHRWQRVAGLEELGTVDAYLAAEPAEVRAGLFAYARNCSRSSQ